MKGRIWDVRDGAEGRRQRNGWMWPYASGHGLVRRAPPPRPIPAHPTKPSHAHTVTKRPAIQPSQPMEGIGGVSGRPLPALPLSATTAAPVPPPPPRRDALLLPGGGGDGELEAAAKRLTLLHADQGPGQSWKASFFRGHKAAGAMAGARGTIKGEGDATPSPAPTASPSSSAPSPIPVRPAATPEPAPREAKAAPSPEPKPLRKSSSMMNMGKKAASIIASSILSVRSFVSTHKRYSMEDETGSKVGGAFWHKRVPTEIQGYVLLTPDARYGYDIGGTPEASRDAEIERALQAVGPREAEYRELLRSSLEKMKVAGQRTPEAREVLGRCIALFQGMLEIALKVQEDTVRENYYCVRQAEAMSQEVEVLAREYHGLITEINGLWMDIPQFARDAEGIHQYLCAPMVRFVQYHHLLNRVEGASRNGLEKVDSKRASYVGNSAFFSARTRMTAALRRVRESLHGDGLKGIDERLLHYYDTPWDLSRIQYTDSGESDVAFRRLILYMSRPAYDSYHILPTPPTKVGELAGRHIKKITPKRDGSGYRVGHNAYGSVWTVHMMTDCVLVTKQSSKKADVQFLLFTPTSLEEVAFYARGNIFSIQLSPTTPEIHVDSDAPTIHAFLKLHEAMLEERRKPRDVASIYRIPPAPVPPMAFGQRMVEMVERGWYHVLSGGAESVRQDRLPGAPCPITPGRPREANDTDTTTASMSTATSSSHDEHAGLRECLEQYPCYLADEDIFVPLDPRDSPEARAIHEQHSTLPHMPVVPRLPRYLKQELSLALQACSIYIHAGKWVEVGEVTLVLVVSGPEPAVPNECRIIARSTSPSAPILLNHVVGAGRGVLKCRVLRDTPEHGGREVELLYRWAGQRWFTPYRALARTEEEAIALVDAVQEAQGKVAERARVWRAYLQRNAEVAAAAVAVQEAASDLHVPSRAPEAVTPPPGKLPAQAVHSTVSSVASALTLQGEEEEEEEEQQQQDQERESKAEYQQQTRDEPKGGCPAPPTLQHRPPEAARSSQPHFQRPLPHQLEAVREENRLLAEALAVEIVRHGQLLDAFGPGRSVACETRRAVGGPSGGPSGGPGMDAQNSSHRHHPSPLCHGFRDHHSLVQRAQPTPPHTPPRIMEGSEQNMAALSHFLQQTLSPAQGERTQAEAQLAEAQKQAGFPILLLRLVSLDTTPGPVRYAAVLYFKNTVKRGWKMDTTFAEGMTAAAPIHEGDKEAIKAYLITLMVALPTALQAQLSEAVSIIALTDFPDKWEGLFGELVSKISLDVGGSLINHGILLTAHSILKRWRHQVQSNDFYTEINNVLAVFAGPFLELFKKTNEIIRAYPHDAAVLGAQFDNLLLILKVYESCITQDLADFFVTHLAETMDMLAGFLEYNNPLVANTEPVHRVQAAIADIMVLFVKRFQSDLDPFAQRFLRAFWQLLTSAAAAVAADGDSAISASGNAVISRAIDFLSHLVRIPKYVGEFEKDEVLENVIVDILLPNMMLREADEELFEDDPIEYIRRDLEGSDNETKRRAVADFLRALLENFAQKITLLISAHIQRYLTTYQANPAAEWKAKDTALFLITSLAARSTTASLGATKVNEFLPVGDIFAKHISPELSGTTSHPILVVDALKFLTIFRSQLSKADLLGVLPLVMQHLATTSNPVVVTYAAVCVERILFLKEGGMGVTPLFGEADVNSFAGPLVAQLFSLILQHKTDAKIAENEYLMRAIMRVTWVGKGALLPFVEPMLVNLKAVTESISRNPSNPKFNHYVFETISLVVRATCAGNPALLGSVEEYLFVCFSGILRDRVAEFTPYVFQILCLLLQGQPGVPPRYQQMFASLLDPQLWAATGNIPALVKLLSVYLSKGDEFMSAQLGPCLGITQKLTSSKKWEAFGFELLEAIMEYIPVALLQPQLQGILVMLLGRLFRSKTDYFSKEFVKFLCLLCVLERPGMGVDELITTLDGVQADPLFRSLLKSVILPEMGARLRELPADRRVVEVGMIKLLLKSAHFASSPVYTPLWPEVVEALVQLLEAPVIAARKPLNLRMLDVEGGGEGVEGPAWMTEGADGEEAEYQAGFVALSSSKTSKDHVAGYPDSRAFLRQSMQALPQPRIQEMLQLAGASADALRRYL